MLCWLQAKTLFTVLRGVALMSLQIVRSEGANVLEGPADNLGYGSASSKASTADALGVGHSPCGDDLNRLGQAFPCEKA